MKWLVVIGVLGLVGCNVNQKINPDKLAEQACDCFEQLETGTIDERLDPCLSSPINENFDLIHKSYYTDEPPENAILNYMMDVSILMIQNCDKFFSEMDSMYTNFYPETDEQTVKEEIMALQDSILNGSQSDSIKIGLLHKRIALLTRT